MTAPELKELVREAKRQVAHGSFLVQRAQKRVEKFHSKYEQARKEYNRAKKAKKPKKAELYQARMARNKRKTIVWSKREADAIEFVRDWKGALARRLKKLAALQPKGSHLVDVARKYEGTQEGSSLQRQWAANLGMSSYLPWCSIFVANMLLEAGICTKAQLPSNPAYSGIWLSWSRGRRVNVSEAHPGDLLIFDWGDGGLTDHVGIYMGSGRYISGNHSNQVGVASVPWGNVVGVVRPT